MNWKEFLNQSVPDESWKQYHYLRQLERLVESLQSLDASFDRLVGEVKALKGKTFQTDNPNDLSDDIKALQDKLNERVNERDVRDVDVEYELKRTQDSFESQCRKLRDATLNKAFMEQLRELDEQELHKQEVATKEQSMKLKKALFSCGTHAVIQREQGEELSSIVEKRIIQLLEDLQHDRTPPAEVFGEVREMFLLSARSERTVQA